MGQDGQMRADVVDLFELDPALTHLNHGAFGAVPRVVREAQDRARARIEAGPMRAFRDELPHQLASARETAAAFLGLAPDSAALVRNAARVALRTEDFGPDAAPPEAEDRLEEFTRQVRMLPEVLRLVAYDMDGAPFWTDAGRPPEHHSDNDVLRPALGGEPGVRLEPGRATGEERVELYVPITFPGEVLETNGRVQGTTVTWRPVFGERTEITAVASAVPDSAGGDDGSEGTEAAGSTESSGGDALRYAILGLIVLAVAVGVYVIVRRRGPSEAPRVPPPPAEPPSEGPIA